MWPTWIAIDDLICRSPATSSTRIANGPAVLQLFGCVGLVLVVRLILHVIAESSAPTRRRARPGHRPHHRNLALSEDELVVAS